MSSLLALTGEMAQRGFRSDSRFAVARPADPGPYGPSEALAPDMPLPEQAAQDPVALAFSEGFALAMEQARAEADAARAEAAAAHEALELAFTRLDTQMAETLRQRLIDTVLVLCEQTLVPFALDTEALAQRAERAMAMFTRAEDEKILRLHPDDLALVSQRLQSEWTVLPDPSLERGALRVETPLGGVEDGPAEWRRALAEAFHAC